MKLFELIQPNTIIKAQNANFPRNDRSYSPDNPRHEAPPSANLAYAGGGIQGRAFYKKTQPNSVVKYFNIDDPKKDGYLQFLRYVAKMQSNPFFPRIYNLKVYDTRDEQNDPGNFKHARYTGVVEMEKLLSIRDPKVLDIVPELFRNLGIEFGEDFTKTYSSHDDDTKSRLISSQIYDVVFGQHENIENILLGSDNKEFVQAVLVVRNLMNKLPNIALDLHVGNWMVRLTAHGPQLVIIDPVVND